MRVDDAGGGGLEHAGEGAHGGFAGVGGGGGEEVRGDGDGGREGVEVGEGGHLLGVLRHDPFARIAVGDVVARAEIVEHFFAAQAK